jgi:hypothetical protein
MTQSPVIRKDASPFDSWEAVGGSMFAVFTLSNGRSIRIDTSVVLAVEDLETGCRIHIGGAAFDVKETASAVLEELDEDEEDEDDED